LKVAIAGSTGFIGRNTVAKFAKEGIEVHALLRNTSEVEQKRKVLENLGAKPFIVDYFTPSSVAHALSEVDVLLHVAGASSQSVHTNFEESNVLLTKNVVTACLLANVKKIVYNSGLGVNQETTQCYFISKYRCEIIIKQSGLEYVIFRPSYIVGVGDEFSEYLLQNILGDKPIPIFGSGEYRIQPVFVDDVTEIYLRCVKGVAGWNKTFDLVGTKIVSFKDYITLLASALHKKPVFSYVSLEEALRDAMRPSSERKTNPYMSVDELDVLISDFVSDATPLERAFGLKLTPLEEIVKRIAYHFSKRS